jgi:mono/diheme cytochrome c family protein/Tol biopolymer transport system component
MRSWRVYAILTTLIVVVAVGGWLASRSARLAANGVTQTVQAGELRVSLQMDDAAIGQRVADLKIADAAGKPVDVAAVRLRFSMIGMDMGATEIDAQPVGAGHYQARGQFFTMVGDWAIQATVMRDGKTPLQVPFTTAIAAPGETQGPINPYQVTSETVAAGQKLYVTNCVPCHGASGKGDGPSGVGLNPRPGDFTQHMVPGKHNDGQVFLWIANGYPNSAMPAWSPRLNDEQIWQLVGYLRTFGRPAAPGQPTAQAVPGAATPAPEGPAQFSAQVPNAQEPLPPIVFTRQGNVWRSAGDGGAPQPLTNLQGGAYAEYPTIAPDGGSIAFVAITPPPVTATVPLPTSTLYVIGADGKKLRPIWSPAEGLLGMPTWSADGQSLTIAANGVRLPQSGPAQPTSRDLQVIRIDLPTGAKQALLNDALDPSLSRDGTQMAYLKLSDDGYTMSLQVAAPDGSGSRQLIGGADFQGFYAPRFSPDGKQIVVAAIGGPQTDGQGNPIKASAPSALDRLLGLLEPPVAEAHGLPWDLWVVNSDGSGLRRLTSFYEDLPMAAFAPDGKQIAAMGLGGIYLMDADGSRLRRIDSVGDHGGLDWARGG